MEGYIYTFFKEHFRTKDIYYSHLDSLSKVSRNKFLKLSNYYGLLIKRSHLTSTKTPYTFTEHYIDELNNTIKFISLISLIESLYSDHKYIDFFDWLYSKKNKSLCNIKNRDELKFIHEKYLNDHGSIRKFKKFFYAIPEYFFPLLSENITIRKIVKKPDGSNNYELLDSNIDLIASILYKLRSRFVHDAELDLAIGNTPTALKIDNVVIESYLSIESLSTIFEIVFLTKFGFPIS